MIKIVTVAVAYALVGAFMIGVAAVGEAHSRSPDAGVVVAYGIVWPFVLMEWAYAGLKRESEVYGDE